MNFPSRNLIFGSQRCAGKNFRYCETSGKTSGGTSRFVAEKTGGAVYVVQRNYTSCGTTRVFLRKDKLIVSMEQIENRYSHSGFFAVPSPCPRQKKILSEHLFSRDNQ